MEQLGQIGYLLMPDLGTSMNLLLIVTFVLLLATILLFLISIGIRIHLAREEKRAQKYESEFLPAIFNYMDGETSIEDISEMFDGINMKYSVFEKSIIKLLKNVDGEDAVKLRKLLVVEPVFNFHLSQLKSDNEIERIKGCNYFRFTDLVNREIISLLKKLVHAENIFMSFSAASAMMASNELSDRSYALETYSKRRGISKMALLELFYRFIDDSRSQTEEEALALEKIILNDDIHSGSRALLIQCVTETNYYFMIDSLQQWLESDTFKWQDPTVLVALINAQKSFYNPDALDRLNHLLNHKDEKVTNAASIAIAELDQNMDVSNSGNPHLQAGS